MDLIKKSKLVSLLNRVLRQEGKHTNESEIMYVCPFHRAINNVSRKKFGIKLDTAEYNCFACGECGKSYKSLFKKLKAEPSSYKELYSIIGESFKPERRRVINPADELRLPDEFKSLSIPSNSFQYKHALRYVRSRNITRDDILRYNIGYCEDGLYRNRIIVPSYDSAGIVNFFSARDFTGNASFKYLLPKWSKDIIGFELFIDWEYPITLVEGSMDAISIRNNVIPLFGKSMSNSLKEAIFDNDVSHVNICLDSDAMKNSIQIHTYLSSHSVSSSIIEMDKKDPSELGFNKISKIIRESDNMDFSKLFALKLRYV